MPDPATIVIIGHCGADAHALAHLARRAVPQVHVVVAGEQSSLAVHQHVGAVWLVNRVLEGTFSTGSGIDLIRSSKREGGATMLLISNYADAQAQAVAAGAAPGFGKNQLGSPHVIILLRSLVEGSARIAPEVSTGD